MIGFSTQQWNYAFLFAIFIHISLFITFTHETESTTTATARDVGLHGIDIALGPAGGISAPVVEEANETEVVEEVIEEPVIEEIEPEPIPEEKPVEVKKEPEVVIKKKEVKKIAPKPPVVEKAKPVEKVKPTPKKSAQPSTMALSGTQDKQDTDSGDTTTGGGIQGVTTSYTAVLQSWLEKHKKYPRRARRRGQEGVVLLYFKMDSDGNVLSYTIKESSGYSQLDDEVEAMIKRAQPLPPIPEEMGKEILELIVPVQFNLR